MPDDDESSRHRVCELNDRFRTTWDRTLGKFFVTPGIEALPHDLKAKVFVLVIAFDAFTADNDPRGEHDFGSFDVDGQKFFFKIDYYDRELEFGSDDPADPAKTTRVLTLMLAEEY